MAKVMGLGGVFFKASDPAALAAWYAEWLGMEIDSSFNGSVFQADSLAAGSYTVWSPFEKKTDYFAPSAQEFMINLMVDDLDGALAQVVEGGAEIVGEPQEYEYGRFGWFLDPDGNKVELWQPLS